MSIFLLPKILMKKKEKYNDVQLKVSSHIPGVAVCHSLYNSLCQTKVQIEQNDVGWDICKKITNPFEFIHTIIPGHKTQVSKLTPLSRSFYKMIEISTIFNLCNNNGDKDDEKDSNDVIKMDYLTSDYIHNLSKCVCDMNEIQWCLHDTYHYNSGGIDKNENETSSDNMKWNSNLFTVFKNKNTFYDKKKNTDEKTSHDWEDKINESQNIDENNSSEVLIAEHNYEDKFKSFHLAEGPGGFIEAVAYVRNNKNDEYYGMTLINNDMKCPGWRNSKKFLQENPNVYIEKGVDNTGNILSRENFIHCYQKYKNSMNLITGDGGVDFSEDFNNQEYIATKLIIAQVLYALAMQSNNGNFILKVFDTFSRAMIDILYLLSSLYKYVYVMKPQTSRYANSEKYIICKGYLLNENKKRIKYVIKTIYDSFDILSSNLYIETLFNVGYSKTFIYKIEEMNIIFGKRQIDNILCTLHFMTNKHFDKIDYYKKKNIQKCIKWCEKFNIQFHKNIKSANIFLTNINANVNKK
jgi:23S rRNA U2552 (ribose-2'-O)-methylase RlmE/FtsJ